MTARPADSHCLYELLDGAGTAVTLRLRGIIDPSAAAALLAELRPRLAQQPLSLLTIDFGDVVQPGDFALIVGLELKKIVLRKNAAFRAVGASDPVLRLLETVPLDDAAKRRRDDALTRLGAAAIRLQADLRDMLCFVGALCVSVVRTLRRPRSLRIDDTVAAMQNIGVDALPIVGLISFLLGLIMAFMSAVQLRQFGANIYVASLVSLAMTRELGPIMTAIIVAGRSGSAFAAEIGTMKISDEIDALTTRGFDPVRFLAVPKLVAATVVVPLLVLFSDLFAIVGGLIVGVGMLDLTPGSYVAQTVKTLEVFDVLWGVGKGWVFAVLIAWIGCFRGFQVRGGAASVGQATTSAVVSGIFLIILMDSICAVILRYWG